MIQFKLGGDRRKIFIGIILYNSIYGFKVKMGENYHITNEIEGFNMFNLLAFDNNGNVISTVLVYCDDFGEMRSGASRVRNFYILYDSDKDY